MDCFWMFELPAVLVRAAGFPPQQAAAPYRINRHQRWLLAGKRLGLDELSHRRAWAWAHGNSFGKRSLWRSLKTRKPERSAQCRTTQYSKTPVRTACCLTAGLTAPAIPLRPPVAVLNDRKLWGGLLSTLFSTGDPLPHPVSNSSCCSHGLTVAQCRSSGQELWPKILGLFLEQPFMHSHAWTGNTFLLECSRYRLPSTPESALNILPNSMGVSA